MKVKELARRGQSDLEEAIVLLEARREGRYLGPAGISKRAGIFRGVGYMMVDAITTGILVKLLDQKRVRRCGRGCWELTDEEFACWRDDGE